MAVSLIRGIVYSAFDDKIGPEPFAWLPATLSRDLLELVSWESINMRIRTSKIMKPLCHIPLPKFKAKMLVKMFQYSDKNKRGQACDTSLAVIFNEEDDLIFYKYIKDFEEIFEKFAIEINLLQEKASGKAKLVRLIATFGEALDNLIASLHAAEMAPSGQQAFPEDEPEGTITPGGPLKFKIIVCGDPSVGKTSTILKYTNQAFKRTYMSTLGVNLTERSLPSGNKSVNFIIWDIAGQAKFSSFRKQFYNGAHGVILVYDMTDLATFHNIKGWYKDIKNVVGDVPVIILGNKKDLDSERKVTRADLDQLGRELPVKVFETSALTGENVDHAFEFFAERLGYK
jgi:small GTP-binding protein